MALPFCTNIIVIAGSLKYKITIDNGLILFNNISKINFPLYKLFTPACFISS